MSGTTFGRMSFSNVVGIGSSSHVLLEAALTVYDFLFCHSLEALEGNITVCHAQFCGFSDPLIDQITIFVNEVISYLLHLGGEKYIEPVC